MSPEQADVPDPRVDDTTEAASEGTAAPGPGTAPDAAPSQDGPLTADVVTTPAGVHAKVHWLPRPPHGGEPIEPRTVYRWSVAAGLGLLSVVLAAMAVYTVRGILVLVLVALFIAVSLDPAVRWLLRHGWRRGWAVTFIFLVALASVSGLIAAVLPQLIKEATSLSDDLPRYIDSMSERSHRVQEFLQRLGLAGELQRLAQELPGKIGASVVGFI
ncbi:MAG TPA: AI-2E family transporter, partial [Micromonosporaceae bacterium]